MRRNAETVAASVSTLNSARGHTWTPVQLVVGTRMASSRWMIRIEPESVTVQRTAMR